jgi:hypothetical protein
MSPPVVASHPSNLHQPPLIVFDHCWPPPSPPLITFYITFHHQSSHQNSNHHQSSLWRPSITSSTTVNQYFDHQSDHHRLLLWPTPLLNNMIGPWISHSLNWVPNFPIYLFICHFKLFSCFNSFFIYWMIS